MAESKDQHGAAMSKPKGSKPPTAVAPAAAPNVARTASRPAASPPQMQTFAKAEDAGLLHKIVGGSDLGG